MKYTEPVVIILNAAELTKYITAAANSSTCPGHGNFDPSNPGICPNPSNYTTNPCSGNYNFETCEPEPMQYDTRLDR